MPGPPKIEVLNHDHRAVVELALTRPKTPRVEAAIREMYRCRICTEIFLREAREGIAQKPLRATVIELPRR